MEITIQIVVMILLLGIAVIDAKTMEIPDGLNGALGAAALLSAWLMPEISLMDRSIGALCVSVPMYLLCILIPNAFGGGDVKLVFVMGFFLGWRLVLTGSFLAILLGGLQACYLIIHGNVKAGESAYMAFGPALCAGMILAMIWGEELISWYFGWFY